MFSPNQGRLGSHKSSKAFIVGITYGMRADRKITVHVEPDLLARAQRASKAGITETVRKGLELLAATEAYDRILALKGKVSFSIDLDELRSDW